MEGYKKVIWLKKRSDKLLKERTRKKLKAKNKRITGNHINVVKGSRNSSYPRNKRIQNEQEYGAFKFFVVPEKFSIEQNTNATLSFFTGIINYIDKEYTSENKKIIIIDATRVKVVSESALMYLFAIVCDAKSDKFIIRGYHPHKKSAKQLFKRLGFNNVLRKDKFIRQDFEKDEGMLIRGNIVDNEVVGDVCRFVADKTSNDTRKLYGALVELMCNTVQHAYDEENRLEKKWQLFLFRTKKCVQLIFLDTGKGIPRTVKTNWKDTLASLFTTSPGSPKDSNLLKSAFKGDFRSQTEDPNRGRGLPQIYDVMNDKNIRNVFVYSGNAVLKRLDDGHNDFSDQKNELFGTLYEMNIVIREEEHGE